jgi:hypothetical protein
MKNGVSSRSELIDFVSTLAQMNTDQISNIDTVSFLEALGAWLKDCNGFYVNTGQEMNIEQPQWQLFADALAAATIYE